MFYFLKIVLDSPRYITHDALQEDDFFSLVNAGDNSC